MQTPHKLHLRSVDDDGIAAIRKNLQGVAPSVYVNAQVGDMEKILIAAERYFKSMPGGLPAEVAKSGFYPVCCPDGTETVMYWDAWAKAWKGAPSFTPLSRIEFLERGFTLVNDPAAPAAASDVNTKAPAESPTGTRVYTGTMEVTVSDDKKLATFTQVGKAEPLPGETIFHKQSFNSLGKAEGWNGVPMYPHQDGHHRVYSPTGKAMIMFWDAAERAWYFPKTRHGVGAPHIAKQKFTYNRRVSNNGLGRDRG